MSSLDYQRITVFLIGNATQDAEFKQAQEEGGQAYGDFRLAVRDRNGESHYFPIRCFGRLAESVTHIKRGQKLFVDGDLEMTAHTDEEGRTNVGFRVVANTYRLLDSGRRSTGDEIRVPSPVEIAADEAER